MNQAEETKVDPLGGSDKRPNSDTPMWQSDSYIFDTQTMLDLFDDYTVSRFSEEAHLKNVEGTHSGFRSTVVKMLDETDACTRKIVKESLRRALRKRFPEYQGAESEL